MTRRAGREPYYVRRRRLSSEAIYLVLDEEGLIVSAEVVRAPGLEPGTRVRLTAREVRAMERFDPVAEQTAAPQPLKRRVPATRAVVPVEMA
jgi:hypothetical protein